MKSVQLQHLLCAVALLSSAGTAQEEAPDSVGTLTGGGEIIEDAMEEVISESEEQDLLDRLQWLQENPLDLNLASADELQTIPGILPDDASSIVRLRSMLGRFSSLSQVELVREDGVLILEKVRPFVFVEEKERIHKRLLHVRTRAQRDLQPRQGFVEEAYFGSSLKTYSRIVYSPSRSMEMGALFEKDPGELPADGYFSGYAMIKDMLFLDKIIVGDYVVESGQGVALWRASAFGKGSETVDIKRTAAGIVPYRSTDEFNFLRGGALSLSVETGADKVTVFGFFSRRSIPGTRTEEGISSFYSDGLFRTTLERDKKNGVREQLIGMQMQFLSHDAWSIGATAYASSFDVPILGNSLGDVEGTKVGVVSIDGAATVGRATLFGEVGTSGRQSFAGVGGMILRAGPSTDAALGFREYNPRYVALHANAFGEFGTTNNERGLYFGLRHQVFENVRLSAYYDLFRRPWVTFTNPFPTSGRDLMIQAELQLLQQLKMAVRYSEQLGETAVTRIDQLGRTIRVLDNESRRRMRVTGEYQVSRKLRLKTRFEAVVVSSGESSENGLLLYQDLRYFFSQMVFEARIVFFDTHSFESRIYQYENDLRGVFSNPALFGKGRRWYLLFGTTLHGPIRLSLKFSQTEKENVSVIGSGSQQIRGSVENKLSAQLDLRW